jgi:hypothetical protein
VASSAKQAGIKLAKRQVNAFDAAEAEKARVPRLRGGAADTARDGECEAEGGPQAKAKLVHAMKLEARSGRECAAGEIGMGET